MVKTNWKLLMNTLMPSMLIRSLPKQGLTGTKIELHCKKWIGDALQMFCLLNSQMNACEPNPKTTNSDFNRWKSVVRYFVFMLFLKTSVCCFRGPLVIFFIILLRNSVVFTPSHLCFSSHLLYMFWYWSLLKSI